MCGINQIAANAHDDLVISCFELVPGPNRHLGLLGESMIQPTGWIRISLSVCVSRT